MKRISAAFFAALMLAAVLAPGAAASHWSSVEEVSARTGQTCADGTKIEDIVSGNVYALGDFGAIRIWLEGTADGQTLSFATSDGTVVNSIIIKGGPVSLPALKYNYVPGTSADSGLHAPLNASNGKWYGLSHICFFADKK